MLAERMRSLSDRQVGQLMFDHIGDEYAFGSPETAICNEATQRLFRSPAGARSIDEFFNDPHMLPLCPRCGEAMMRFVGIGEPDYLECVSTRCGYAMQNDEAK